MPRRTSSIEPAKFNSAKKFWVGKNTAKPELVQELKDANFKPLKNRSLSEIGEEEQSVISSSDVGSNLNYRSSVTSEECICGKQNGVSQQLEDNSNLIENLLSKIAHLQNNCTYSEVEKLRLEGSLSKLQLEVTKKEGVVEELKDELEGLKSEKDSMSHVIETVENNSVRLEKENRDMRETALNWEREKQFLEDSLQEARAESRLLETYSQVRSSSPIRSALDDSVVVIGELNSRVGRLNTERDNLHHDIVRADLRATEVEEENRSLRQDKLRLSLENNNLKECLEGAKTQTRSLEVRLEASRGLLNTSDISPVLPRLDVDRSLSVTPPRVTSSPPRVTSSPHYVTSSPDVCPTCNYVHSTLSPVCSICNCVHRSPRRSGGGVCTVCYNSQEKCPRSPRNFRYSKYSPTHPDLSVLSNTF